MQLDRYLKAEQEEEKIGRHKVQENKWTLCDLMHQVQENKMTLCDRMHQVRENRRYAT